MVKRPTHGRSHNFRHGADDDDDEPELQAEPQAEPEPEPEPAQEQPEQPGPLTSQGVGVDAQGDVWWSGPHGYVKIGSLPKE